MTMETKKEVRVRFAPSPTGMLHAGNMRTAVFNWIFAAKNKGKFILRIEDTDTERSTDEYAKEILESLRWLGLGWDEGPHYQSRRTEIYTRIADPMLTRGKLYPCFCSDAQLEEDRKAAEKRGRPPVYVGRCANMDPAERKERMKREPYALRFRITGDTLSYTDAIRGVTTVNLRLMGDFIVMRSNGTVTYNLAATIDDILMKVTHVIRGEDHMSNTPKQILMMRTLGFAPPVYAHLPILLADDNTKLSKRHRHSAFAELIADGYLPEAVFNFLALLGWHPEDKREDLTVEEIIKNFDLAKVATRASHYNLQKLGWLNKQKIHHAEPERLQAYGKRFIKKHAAAFDALSGQAKLTILSAVHENISRLGELDGELAPFFEYTIEDGAIAEAQKHPARAVAEAMAAQTDNDDYRAVLQAASARSGAKGKSLYLPARVALSGRTHGPELEKLYRFLSPAERAARLKRFLEMVTA